MYRQSNFPPTCMSEISFSTAPWDLLITSSGACVRPIQLHVYCDVVGLRSHPVSTNRSHTSQAVQAFLAGYRWTGDAELI